MAGTAGDAPASPGSKSGVILIYEVPKVGPIYFTSVGQGVLLRIDPIAERWLVGKVTLLHTLAGFDGLTVRCIACLPPTNEMVRRAGLEPAMNWV